MAVKRRKPALIKITEVVPLVANGLGINTETVKRMIREGHLPKPAINANQKSRWWRRSDIEAFLQGKLAA